MDHPVIEIMDTTLRDGEQTSGVSFVPHEKLMIARMLLEDLKVDRIEVASARVSDGELNAVSKGSEKHCRYQLKKTLEEHLEDIRRTVAYALDRDMEVNLYLEDWSNGMKDSPEYVFGLVG